MFVSVKLVQRWFLHQNLNIYNNKKTNLKRQCLTIFIFKAKFVILLYIKIWNTRKDHLLELNYFFAFKDSYVILLSINIIKDNKTLKQLSSSKFTKWKISFYSWKAITGSFVKSKTIILLFQFTVNKNIFAVKTLRRLAFLWMLRELLYEIWILNY
jgi:hypothetical protein